MKIIHSHDIDYVPASHEDPDNPGVLKKVLFTHEEFEGVHLQMINWARMAPGKTFRKHYHEDMDEVFIILSGQAQITIGDESAPLHAGDAVFLPMDEPHQMTNTGSEDLEYLAVGISLGKHGQTVVVHEE